MKNQLYLANQRKLQFSGIKTLPVFIDQSSRRRFPSYRVAREEKNKHLQGVSSWKRIYRSQFPKAIYLL